MKFFFKSLSSALFLVLAIQFSACNESGKGNPLKTKEDSVALAKAIITQYPELCSGDVSAKNQSEKSDTIELPNDFEKRDKLIDGYYYKYFKAKNYLVSKDPREERGFNLIAMPGASGEEPLSRVEGYVQNYKEWVNGGTAPYTKQYSYMIDSIDIDKLTKLKGYKGIRVYMGIPNKAKPLEHTLILTGWGSDSSDLYIPPAAGTTEQTAIDRVAPCPWNCPCVTGDARTRLGRNVKDPAKKP